MRWPVYLLHYFEAPSQQLMMQQTASVVALIPQPKITSAQTVWYKETIIYMNMFTLFCSMIICCARPLQLLLVPKSDETLTPSPTSLPSTCLIIKEYYCS